jgi:hypothetical protein
MPASFAQTCCTTFIAAFFAACAARSPAPTGDEPAEISVHGAELTFRGPLSHEANARLFALAASATERPRTLTITSGGGDVEAGMELGTWIFAKGLDVYIPRYCISSCANYVFTAGQRKILDDTALLIWHGGATQADLLSESSCLPPGSCDEEEMRNHLADYLTNLQRLESEFFAMIGVDQDITVLGQRSGYDCRESGSIGWYYSVPDMAELGVTNVRIDGDEWQPAALFEGMTFCRVALAK